jgi:hypothetical protein
MKRHHESLMLWVVLVSWLGHSTSSRGELRPDPELTAATMMTREVDRAIAEGLSFLAAAQNEDGSFGGGGLRRNPAVCSLAGMSFISSGSTPSRGPYGRHVDQCIDFVTENCDENGFIHVPDDATRGPMYGHGFATLFLAEIHGMTPNPRVRDCLSRAIQLIIHTQNDEGGWRYLPQRKDADISVTICQIMALRAAKNAGIYVPSETVDRCIDYVRRSQNSDGGFMYMLHGGPSAFPRSAAGVVALYSAGVYEGDEITQGLDYLLKHLPGRQGARQVSHYFYGHYYAVQAMWHAGGDYWAQWYPAVRDELIASQNKDGSWMPPTGPASPEYGTAMATLVLQVPNNQLPIFQR